MSDSEHSSVTYTSVPSPVEDYSDNGSPKGDGPPSPDYVLGPKEPEKAPLSLDYLPGSEEPEQAPLSPDYVPGPEEPKQALPSPVYLPYVSKLVYPEYMPPEDDVFPSEEVTKPLPHIPSPPLPIPSPPPDSPTHIEISESCLPLRKRLRFASPTLSQEVGESSTAGAARQNEPVVARDDPYSLELGYGITNTWDELVGASEEIAPTTLHGVNQRVTDLSTTQMIEFQKHHGPAKGPVQPDAPGEAGMRPVKYYGLFPASRPSTPVITTPTPGTTTSVTNAQLQAMIDQGVTAALAVRDANRNGDDSHTSGMESEMWNLKVKGTDVVAYSQHFQELALMCDRMFPKEIDKVKRYVDGLPDTIHGSVMATKPKTMQDAIEFATQLMNKKINTWAERQADNKRKSDDTTRINHQQPNKRQNTGRAYAAGNGKRKENQGNYISDCPELKNQDHGNQAGGTRAHGMVHALEGGETNQDLNDVENDINA
nr:hypothetical protein [Tanacetum cinerariifolium]